MTKLTKRALARNRAFNRKYYAENREELLAKARLRRYGLTPEGYALLLNAQGNRCAICNDLFTDESVPQVDHDHSCHPGRSACSNCIRGLLCKPCNMGLGYFKDDLNRLLAAVQYLDQGASIE